MSYTLDENGTVLTETKDGVTMPVDCSFEKVNDWVHGVDVQFEELQALCLGMAAENDRLRSALADLMPILQQWEPDHSSGEHRAIWSKAEKMINA